MHKVNYRSAALLNSGDQKVVDVTASECHMAAHRVAPSSLKRQGGRTIKGFHSHTPQWNKRNVIMPEMALNSPQSGLNIRLVQQVWELILSCCQS